MDYLANKGTGTTGIASNNWRSCLNPSGWRNADKRRKKFFRPDFASMDAFQESVDVYRSKLISMLGWPLCNYSEEMGTPDADVEFVAEDELGSIYRLNIHVGFGLSTYGVLFVPEGKGPHPLIISQHGGQGTPELCSGFFDSANYNDMSRRILRRGFAVFSPQLLLWAEEFGPTYDRPYLERQLKQLGGSMAALEIFKIKRSIDYLAQREDIDQDRIGMAGLSYGGFYTLFAAACDVRIKAALSSCFFNNRFVYDWQDWTWVNSGNTFLDAEVASLICPRSLFIEVGKNDPMFDVKYVRDEYNKVLAVYERLGLTGNLRLEEFEGVHELNKSDVGIEFLCERVAEG